MSFVSLYETDGGELVVLKTLPSTEKNLEKLRAERVRLIAEGRAVTLITTLERPQEWGPASLSRGERRKRERQMANLMEKMRKRVPNYQNHVDDHPSTGLVLPSDEGFDK